MKQFMSLLIFNRKDRLEIIENRVVVIFNSLPSCWSFFSLVNIFFILFFISSCGLPTYSYLAPPQKTQVRDDPTTGEYDLIFQNAYTNSLNIFQGYEIFYKIYYPDSTSSTTYLTDFNKIDGNSSPDYTLLKNNGFRRLYISIGEVTSSTQITSGIDETLHSNSKPAFLLDENMLDADFEIRFNFLNENYNNIESYNTSTYTFDPTPYLYRWVYNDQISDPASSDYIAKSFNDTDFDINDSDMPTSITSANMTDVLNLYITFYICSYGRDTEDITQSVYSEPEYLGTLSFDCSITDSY